MFVSAYDVTKSCRWSPSEETGLPTDNGNDYTRNTFFCIGMCSQSYSVRRWRSLELLFHADDALHSL